MVNGQKLFLYLLAIAAFSSAVLTVYFMSTNDEGRLNPKILHLNSKAKDDAGEVVLGGKVSADVDATLPNYNVHIFYYAWYGNPQVDEKYVHWNHEYLPHWDKKIADRYPKGIHIPPEDIGANFYPQLGPYSSRDPVVLQQHMRWIAETRAGVVVVSWYPPGEADTQGQPADALMPAILDAANEHRLKVAFHIEPYKDRSASNLRANFEYILNTYGAHPAFYRHLGRPLVYMYDSYLIPETEWRTLLQPESPTTIRKTPIDFLVIGLLVKANEKYALINSGFDGLYTYFAAEGFTYGSTRDNWSSLRVFAKKNSLIFIPSLGPGYLDTRVRPWNGHNSRDRQDGVYYAQGFDAVRGANAEFVSITSFNEWHEGTQIEPAIPKMAGSFQYEDYSPRVPDNYLKLTRAHVDRFSGIK